MPTFEQGDVVRIPFPYVEREKRQYRPALVISRRGLGEGDGLLWVLMITSAENRPWPGDVAIRDATGQTGLPVPSVVRTSKIATIAATSAQVIGRLGAEVMDVVTREVAGTTQPAPRRRSP